MAFYVQSSGSLVKSGFRKVLNTEAAKKTKVFTNWCDNPFQDSEIESGVKTLLVNIMFRTIRDYLSIWIFSLDHLNEEISAYFLKTCHCCQDFSDICLRSGFHFSNLYCQFIFPMHILNLFGAALDFSRWYSSDLVQTVLSS